MYCEKRITNPDGERREGNCEIEHVVPKSADPTRIFDWTNLAMSCRPEQRSPGGCGDSKANNPLPIGCDPRDIRAADLVVTTSSNGMLLPSIDGCEKAGIDPQLLKQAIDMLRLNRDSLKRARKVILDEIRASIRKITLNGEQALELDMSDIVRKNLQPDKHGHLVSFWTTYRCGYKHWAEDYIAENEHIIQ